MWHHVIIIFMYGMLRLVEPLHHITINLLPSKIWLQHLHRHSQLDQNQMLSMNAFHPLRQSLRPIFTSLCIPTK
jgi:hypothetical protein